MREGLLGQFSLAEEQLDRVSRGKAAVVAGVQKGHELEG